jgi:hypothetical protein
VVAGLIDLPAERVLFRATRGLSKAVSDSTCPPYYERFGDLEEAAING